MLPFILVPLAAGCCGRFLTLFKDFSPLRRLSPKTPPPSPVAAVPLPKDVMELLRPALGLTGMAAPPFRVFDLWKLCSSPVPPALPKDVMEPPRPALGLAAFRVFDLWKLSLCSGLGAGVGVGSAVVWSAVWSAYLAAISSAVCFFLPQQQPMVDRARVRVRVRVCVGG